MAQIESISLQESLPPDAGEQEPQEGDEVASSPDQGNSRPQESKTTRISVLVSSGVLQLSIWGYAMSYGVIQEYLYNDWTLQGSRSITGIIGTTTNGVMYLSMPFLFAPFARRWAHRRQAAALCGAALTCISFILSSFSTNVWHLVVTQGVLAAFGCALIYSPMTLSLGEWSKSSNRAVAYGITLSCKNIVGSTCPFLFRGLLDHYGFRNTLRIWAGIAAGTSIIAILLIPTHSSSIELSSSTGRRRKIPWTFLKYKAFYIYSIAIIFQSSGYGIPQTYLSTYARDVTLLSQTTATLMLTIFNVPGIASSSFFGYLSDNKRLPLSASIVTSIPPVSSALSAFLLWGLTSRDSLALLLLFSITFGFFSSGYSATWGGVLNEMEREAAARNEAIDSGMVYGLLNGVRGIGYVSGGLASLILLKAGTISSAGRFGYETQYGPLIIFTGLSSVIGGWAFLWNGHWKKWPRFV